MEVNRWYKGGKCGRYKYSKSFSTIIENNTIMLTKCNNLSFE